MTSTVQSRIYSMLVDLIPEMANGRTHYAAPRLASDMAVHCTVDETPDGHLRVQIAHDKPGRGTSRRSSSISFDVDPGKAVARVTDYYAGVQYNVARRRSDAARDSVNVFAANWLGVFNSLGRMFQPVDQMVQA